MGRRSMVLAAGVWLAIVVVVSVATWTVIDAAGRDVTTRPSSDPAAAAGATSTLTPSATRTPRAGGKAGAKPTTRRTTPPAPLPTDDDETPEADASTPTPAAPRTSSRPAAPQPQERTWAGTAGSVSARCTGSRIDLLSASPSNGWRMEVDERGPSRVRVEFRSAAARSGGSDDGSGSGSGGGGDKVEVRAECGGGVPRFRIDT